MGKGEGGGALTENDPSHEALKLEHPTPAGVGMKNPSRNRTIVLKSNITQSPKT